MKAWYKFSASKLHIMGLVTVLTIVFVAVLAPFVSPYPEHAGLFLDFAKGSTPPSWINLCGTDLFGRDIFSRIIFGFRYSLAMATVILTLVVPTGSFLGLFAGYNRGTYIEVIIMRFTDIFLAVPPLILALTVSAILEPSAINAMFAISLMWWPWYCRLTYGTASALRNELFVQAAHITGANTLHILFREIFPNTLGIILTRASLDVGIVIMLGSMLSFLGLGAQPPTPDLGTMVAESYKYLPEIWWMTFFPAFAILLVILSFNLFGDGIRDMFATEVA